MAINRGFTQYPNYLNLGRRVLLDLQVQSLKGVLRPTRHSARQRVHLEGDGVRVGRLEQLRRGRRFLPHERLEVPPQVEATEEAVQRTHGLRGRGHERARRRGGRRAGLAEFVEGLAEGEEK